MDNFPSFIFSLASAPLLIFWALVVLLPKWSWTNKVYQTQLPMLYLALLYSAVVVYGLLVDPVPFAVLLNPDLAGVQGLLGSPIGASAGWIHFLCFDLLVGTFIWRKALAKGHSFLWVSPLLVLTLFLAPMGWLIFETASALLSRKGSGRS
jgi:hypothetical protein